MGFKDGIDVIGERVGMLDSGLELGRKVGLRLGPVGDGVGIGLHSKTSPQGLKPPQFTITVPKDVPDFPFTITRIGNVTSPMMTRTILPVSPVVKKVS